MKSWYTILITNIYVNNLPVKVAPMIFLKLGTKSVTYTRNNTVCTRDATIDWHFGAALFGRIIGFDDWQS